MNSQRISSCGVPTPLYPLLFSDINASTMFHSHTIALNNYSSDFLHSLSVTVVVYHYYHTLYMVFYWLGNLILAEPVHTKGVLLKLPKSLSLCMSVRIFTWPQCHRWEQRVIYLTKIDWLSPMASFIYISFCKLQPLFRLCFCCYVLLQMRMMADL